MSSIQKAQQKVQEAEDILREAREELRRASNPSVGEQIAGFFNDFYGPNTASVLSEGGSYIGSIDVKVQYRNHDGNFASQVAMSNVHRLGYYLGCVFQQQGYLKLRFFKGGRDE